MRTEGIAKIGTFGNAAPNSLSGFFFLEKCRSADPSIHIRCTTVLELHGMQHTVAIEPMMFPLGTKSRIGTIADERTCEIPWDFANDLQILKRRFRMHR